MPVKQHATVEIALLGPLRATRNGICIVPSAGKPRQILALLACQSGTVVTASTLIEEIWGDQPPPSATSTLHTYIRHLRRAIESSFADEEQCDAKDILQTWHGAYVLDVPDAEIDVVEFERRVATGRNAFQAGDMHAAASTLANALRLWSGEALTGVALGARLNAEATRLGESRLSALELRIEADLCLGRQAHLLAELAELTARYPMNERLCQLNMLTLYRCGRQPQALRAFTTVRSTLIRELGVEPSRQLQHLLQLILRSDPCLDRAQEGRAPEALQARA